MKTTDLKTIKNITLSFLHLEIDETDFSPAIVTHPIFESALVYLPKTKKMCNILEDPDGYDEMMDFYRYRIEKADSATDLYHIVRKSYKLAFLKFAEKYLSIKDLSELLADAWITSENPNQDVNVNLSRLASMFRKADKKTLMAKKEYRVYNELPEEFIVYRGVARGRNPQGMSWTRNIKTAEWFAHRFDIDEEIGYIQKATAKKKDVLAYFNKRNEDEIVISTEDLKDICLYEGGNNNE